MLREEGQQRVELPDVAEALQDLYWARDLEALGLPVPQDDTGQYLAIAPDGAKVVSTHADATVVQIHAEACGALDLDSEQVMFFLCKAPLRNMASMGVPFSRALSLVPKAWVRESKRQTGVFIDARDLGEGITFHLFDTNLIRLQDVTALLDFTVPEHLIVKVAGTDGPSLDAGLHRISQGALLTLWAVEAVDVGSEETEEDTSFSDDAEPDPWRRPFYLMAAVYGFQYRVDFMRISVVPEDDSASVVQALEEELSDNGNWKHLCAVHPQPQTEYIAVVVESTWTRMVGLLPVLIAVEEASPRLFAFFVRHEFCLAEIIAVMAVDWKEEYEVYAGGEPYQLRHGVQYQAVRGMLIAICRSGVERPQYQTLEQRLLTPHEWALTDPSYFRPQDPLLLGKLGVSAGRAWRKPTDGATWFCHVV